MPEAAAEVLAQPIALPVYNREDYDSSAEISDEVAAKIAARVLELGATHGFHKETRRPTPEEQSAYQEGRLLNYMRDKPADRHDRVIIVYVRGPVEQACEEFGADPTRRSVRHMVDAHLALVRKAKDAQEKADREAKFVAGVDAFFVEHPQSPAAERYLRTQCQTGVRGAKVPTIQDQSWWGPLLNRDTDRYGTGKKTGAYKPEPSGYSLKVKEAVRFYSSQESYADYSKVLIPVLVTEPTNIEAARRNLAAIAGKISTHNGWAGSGSTYELELVAEPDGVYVILSGRHSISD